MRDRNEQRTSEHLLERIAYSSIIGSFPFLGGFSFRQGIVNMMWIGINLVTVGVIDIWIP